MEHSQIIGKAVVITNKNSAFYEMQGNIVALQHEVHYVIHLTETGQDISFHEHEFKYLPEPVPVHSPSEGGC